MAKEKKLSPTQRTALKRLLNGRSDRISIQTIDSLAKRGLLWYSMAAGILAEIALTTPGRELAKTL